MAMSHDGVRLVIMRAPVCMSCSSIERDDRQSEGANSTLTVLIHVLSNHTKKRERSEFEGGKDRERASEIRTERERERGGGGGEREKKGSRKGERERGF